VNPLLDYVISNGFYFVTYTISALYMFVIVYIFYKAIKDNFIKDKKHSK